MGIPPRYLARRWLNLIAVVWFAATVNFLLPRITAHDPVLEYLLEMATLGGERGDRAQSMPAFYRDWAGLNQPLWWQYLTYMGNMVHLDFGRSFRYYWPVPVVVMCSLSLGTLVSGYAPVETMFSYPGVGHLFSEAILANDYAMIQGIIFFLVLAIALATFILDMTYPLLDPRIRYAMV